MRKASAIALYLCALALSAFGQTATGSIVGTVTDSSGAAVANASVTVTNTGTSSKRDVVTNAEGNFTAPLLPPGSYSVGVTASGFKAFEQTVSCPGMTGAGGERPQPMP